MNDRTQTIVAQFGGRTVHFCLPNGPYDLESIEGAIGSPWAALKRFQEGSWLPSDVRLVLMHAYPGALLMHKLTHVGAVAEVIDRRPAATYAALAHKILSAFLFGMLPEAARFDEADPFNANGAA